jgi:hypothetical protein
VAVTPELVPVVSQAARLLAAKESSDSCTTLVVRSVSSVSVAESLAARGDAPQVWIPDSSVWISRAGTTPASAPVSLARSPVVLAVPAATASALGWPKVSLSTSAVFGPAAGAQPFRLHLPDASASAPAAIGLWAAQGSVAGLKDGRARLTVLLRSSVPASSTPADALAEAARGGSRNVVPASEQALWTHDSSLPAERRLAPLYLGADAALDYPLVVLTKNAAARAEVERLRALLAGSSGTALLASVGFRTPSGKAPDNLAAGLGQNPPALAASSTVAADSVASAAHTATVLRLGSRMLAVVDVGRSSAKPMAGSGSTSRLDLTKATAAAGLNLLPDDSQVGVWAYSYRMRGRRPYVQVAAVAPLDELTPQGNHRQALAAALARLEPSSRSGSGLYETVLDAVLSVQKTWQPGMVNSVVLFTDGRNDDPAGIGIGDLVSRLVSAQDPDRPVPVISILIGTGGDLQAMRAVSAVTGGSAYRAKHASELGAVFLDAIGRRACQPTC